MKKSDPIPVTAIFDIGKTNKKFLLFDKDYKVVYKQQSTLMQAEESDDDGFPCENLELLVDWIKTKLEAAIRSKYFDIKALNFSTYGASLVHLDKDGHMATPFYNYLKPYPGELLETFYRTYGGRESFSLETASPPMGMLNSGLQLYWLKQAKPLMYQSIRRTLHFPQYLSYIFTGDYISEFTSIGCHTGLWSFKENRYHNWLEEEGMLHLFPGIQSVTGTQEIQFKDTKIAAGAGIHDSSSALVPYFLALEDPFILVSTGTWSITLNPFNKDPLTYEELKRDCLCYLNVYGEQVKAARLFMGNEYSHQKQKLDEFFDLEGEFTKVGLDLSLLKRLIKEDDPSKKLQLETAHNSGPFPGEAGEWKLDSFSSYEEAYHQLMLDLVAIQAEAIDLAEGEESVDKLIVTGGFSQNDIFVALLAARFPNKEVYTATLSHASALGAAIAIREDHDKESLKELLELEYHPPLEDTGIEQYIWKKTVTS